MEQTYKEWSDDGYQVKKGETAVGFNEDGEALFHEDQVYDPNEKD